MGDELSVTVRRERGVVIAEVTGVMDMSTVAGLRERLFGLADSGHPGSHKTPNCRDDAQDHGVTGRSSR